MKILIIDTSTEKSLVVFADGKNVLLSLFFSGMQSSRVLFPTIELGFSSLGMKMEDFEAIAVGAGPGSFTGIRVGVSAAQGLAFPKNLPMVGFCSLAGFVSSNEGRFVSIIDARIGGAYILHQEKKNGGIREIGEPKLISKENLIDEVKGYECVGPSFSNLGIDGIEKAPDPTHLAEIANQKLNQKEKEPFKILYLREGNYSS